MAEPLIIRKRVHGCQRHPGRTPVAEIRLPGVTPWLNACHECVEDIRRVNAESDEMMKKYPPPPEIAANIAAAFEIRTHDS